MAQAPAVVVGVPGLGVDVGGDFSVRFINDSSIVLKAKRNKHFPVGYQTMRVEYNLDGTLQALRGATDTGLRGDDDESPHLVLMGDDIFEVDEDGSPCWRLPKKYS